MDKIFLYELELKTIIGIFDWEREIKQTVSIDLEMAADVARAASTDSIDDTLDYKAVAKRIIAFVEDSSFQLIETMAERIAAIVLGEFNVPWVKVTVRKPGAIRGSRNVGICLERGDSTAYA